VPFGRKQPSLKARALQALALRDHSRSELRQKLLRRLCPAKFPQSPLREACGPDPVQAAEAAAHASAVEVEELLDELEAQGLLNEGRFIESRVHARSSRFGNRRIQAELALHGLQVDAETAAGLRDSELDRARAVWARRFGLAQDANPPQPAEVARQMRFLAARGFSPEVIRRVIKTGFSEE